MSVRAARRVLASVAGTQLDPQCVRALLSASLPRVLWLVGPLSLLVNLPFLRGVADVGRVVEQAGASAASRATTAAVAATAAVAVVAAPGVSAAAPTHPSRTARPRLRPAPPLSTRAPPARARTVRIGIRIRIRIDGPDADPDPDPDRRIPDRSSDPCGCRSARPGADPAGHVPHHEPGPGVTFRCRVDGGDRTACGASVSHSGLSKGKHLFEAYAVNADGRKSDPARWMFTVL